MVGMNTETAVAKPPRAPRGKSKVDQARDISIRALLSKGLSHRQIAELLGIARATVSSCALRGKQAGEGYPDPRTAHRDALALSVLDRCLSVGSKMPAKKIRAADAVSAVKAYAGIAWSQESAPLSMNFTEIHIHEALITGPAPHTICSVQDDAKTIEGEIINEINNV